MKKVSKTQFHPPKGPALPSKKQLTFAVEAAAIIAFLLLVLVVLPIEFGLDLTGLGRSLGLNFLNGSRNNEKSSDPNLLLVARAESTFGRNTARSYDAAAVESKGSIVPKENTFRVVLEPGKGAEVKTNLKAGDGFVFRWTATSDVSADMHGERSDTSDNWSTYAVESSQRTASGIFIAPFDGSHGWYWHNGGKEPVVVEVITFGFQPELYELR